MMEISYQGSRLQPKCAHMQAIYQCVRVKIRSGFTTACFYAHSAVSLFKTWLKAIVFLHCFSKSPYSAWFSCCNERAPSPYPWVLSDIISKSSLLHTNGLETQERFSNVTFVLVLVFRKEFCPRTCSVQQAVQMAGCCFRIGHVQAWTCAPDIRA